MISLYRHNCASVVLSTLIFSLQSSLIRQECLEHDQRIVALVSMVRHIEVCLKQQQQQSVGRGLISLEDIIRQTEVNKSALGLRLLMSQSALLPFVQSLNYDVWYLGLRTCIINSLVFSL
jgi:hypothetical protein